MSGAPPASCPSSPSSSGRHWPRRATCTRGRELWRHLWAISDFLESVNYVAGVKAGLDLIGHSSGPRPAARSSRCPPSSQRFAASSRDAVRQLPPEILGERMTAAMRRTPRPPAEGHDNRITLDAVEVHAEGEPGRIVVDAGLVQGAPWPNGWRTAGSTSSGCDC